MKTILRSKFIFHLSMLSVCLPLAGQISMEMQRSMPVIEDASYISLVLRSIHNNMVLVEGGTFMMGSNDKEAKDDEKPVHQVTVSSFYICRYEVTQKEWKAIMGNNPSVYKGNDLPVESVSTNEVKEFITKLNQLSGKQYRLPTEAEWEFAARGGNRSRGFKYAGSNDPDSVAWYGDNRLSGPHPVGKKKANELGLYDMSGNIFELCSDRYGEYSNTIQTNPKGAPSGFGTFRGGAWSHIVQNCRVSNREYGTTWFDVPYYIGFRLCL